MLACMQGWSLHASTRAGMLRQRCAGGWRMVLPLPKDERLGSARS